MATASLVQPYIDLGIVTDPDALADNSTQYLADNIDGWEPNEGNFEVRLINAIAQMAAAIADAAGNVPLDIFINYAQQFFGLAMNVGAYAQATVQFTAQDANGYDITAGTDLTIGGLGFQTTTDTTILNGFTTATATVTAVDVGTAYNGLASDPQVESAEAAQFVTAITVTEPSAGGTDPETATDFANRVATLLLLQTPRPVTAAGFATFALAADIPVDPPVSGSYIGIGRATAVNAFNPSATLSLTGTTTSGSSQVTNASTTTNLGVGSSISGAGIPASTYVLGISGSTITLSNEATASASAVALTGTGLFNQPSWTTVVVADENGNALVSAEQSQMQTFMGGGVSASGIFYDGYCLALQNLAVISATYNDITISYTAYVQPGVDPAGTESAIQAQLSTMLNPLTWGAPQSGDPGSSNAGLNWQNYSTLRLNKVIRWIEDVQGVDYCPIGSVLINGANADLVMDGLAPLPELETVTGTVITETE